MLRALKVSLKRHRNHFLRLLQLYGDQALESNRKDFTNQSFTENKAVINGERYKYVVRHLSRDLIYQKIHLLRDAAFGADCSRVLKIIIVGLKMDSGNAIKNCYML